jgi:hypothetical protein
MRDENSERKKKVKLEDGFENRVGGKGDQNIFFLEIRGPKLHLSQTYIL